MASGRAPTPGPRLEGYEVLGLAGRGGLGVVYRVRQDGTGRLAALKVLELADPTSVATVVDDPDSDSRGLPKPLRRFFREGRALAQVDQHPHVVRLHGSGFDGRGRPYLVLEWLSGGTLGARLRAADEAGVTIGVAEALSITEKLASALAWLHANGIVHRDLKPSNVLFDEPGEPRLTDFGLVRPTVRDASRGDPLTATGAMIGTPHYMAPEQVRGEPDAQGPHTDLWALGAILYEMLTGSPPVLGESMVGVCGAILSRDPDPPSTIVAGLPAAVDAICARALAKRIPDRYRDAAELIADLGALRSGSDVGAVAAVSRTRRRRRARRLLGAGAILAVLAVAGVALLLAPGDAERSDARDGAGAEPPAAPPASEADAVEAGDYLILADADAAARAGADRSRLRRAVAALTGEAPDAVEAANVLENAREPRLAVLVLRTELLGLLGHDDAWREILDDDAVTASPIVRAQRARLRAADPRSAAAADEDLATARRTARAAGLSDSVERIYAGSDGASAWLVHHAEGIARLAGRTRLPDHEARLRELVRALEVRAPRACAGVLGRFHLERDEPDEAIQALADADGWRELLLRAHAKLRRGDGANAAEDAVRAGEHGAPAIEAGAIEIEGLLADGLSDRALDRAEQLAARGAEDPVEAMSVRALRPRLRIQVLHARALAASGRLDDARALIRDARERAGRLAARPATGMLAALTAVVRDPYAAPPLLTRAALRTSDPADEERWRLGIRDLVRSGLAEPDLMAFAREPDTIVKSWQLPLTSLPDLASGGETVDLDPIEERLAEVTHRLSRAPRGDRRTAARALAAIDGILGRDPTELRGWALRAMCLFELDRSAEAEDALLTAQRLAPDAAPGPLIRGLFDPRPGMQRQAVDRAVVGGCSDWMMKVLTAYAGEAGPSPELEERRATIEPLLMTTRTIFRKTGAASLCEDAARRDGGDDAVLWHLVGLNHLLLAKHHGGGDARRARAVEAFLRAAEHASDEERPVHEAAAAQARIDAGLLDETTEALLDRLLGALDGRVPPLRNAPRREPLLFHAPELLDAHGLAHGRARLLALRATTRLGRDDREGARADAEAAATLDPIAGLPALAAVYRE